MLRYWLMGISLSVHKATCADNETPPYTDNETLVTPSAYPIFGGILSTSSRHPGWESLAVLDASDARQTVEKSHMAHVKFGYLWENRTVLVFLT